MKLPWVDLHDYNYQTQSEIPFSKLLETRENKLEM